MPRPKSDPRAQARSAVLRSWIALERFDTRTLGRPDRPADARRRGRRRYVVDVEPGQALPWEPGHAAFGQGGTNDKTEWRHTLLIGQFDLAAGYEAVEACFPIEGDEAELDRERRRFSGGPAPVLALAVTSDGRPVMDSLQVSSAAWSIANTLRVGVNDAQWLVGFEDALSDVRGAFERIILSLGDGIDEVEVEVEAADDVAEANEVEPAAAVERFADRDDVIDEEGIAVTPITWDHLMRLMGAARALFRLDGLLTIRPVVRTSSWIESRRIPLGSGDTLLNSFAVDDLERVAMRLHDNPGGDALRRYLDATQVAVDEGGDRIDVDQDLLAVRELAAPEAVPAGRWPASAEHDLALGQQLAVNLALADDAPSVVAVNGPPGTGKTTMLRELIASVITDRADVLASYDAPSELFGKELRHDGGDYPVRVHKVDERIVGREILLACATNAAAQNVSFELPATTAIDTEWLPRFEQDPPFLADFATAALRAGVASDRRNVDDEGAPPQPSDLDPRALQAWAFVAARLGRRSYRKEFVNTVWWGERGGAWNAGGGRAPVFAPNDRAANGLRQHLDLSGRAANAAAVKQQWADAKQRFLGTRAEVDRIRAQRAELADALRPSDDAAAKRDALRQTLADGRSRIAAVEREREEQAAEAEELLGGRDQLKNPLTRRAVKKVLDRVAQLDRKLETLSGEVEEIGDALLTAEASLARRERLAAEAEQRRSADEPAPFVVPGDEWLADSALRDLRAPWSDAAWNRARTECFLAALALHEATLLATAKETKRNLGVVMDLLSGRSAGLRREVTLAAWQTLFLLVPVVSTTFASLPALLSGLGEEDLGWLLIDEAGQAQPQHAVGALWRCRRAVIVGDPLQLEPVSTLPTSLAAAIRDRYDVQSEFVSPEASVQRLADAATPWGGRRGDDDLWVGVPMNVHRRCESPIFDLVNAIAYGGRMINATRERPAHPALRVETCWLDVPGGGPADGHWLHDEGDRLDALLAYLRGERSGGVMWGEPYDFREVFAVSPFRDVARQLERRVRDPRHAGMTGGTIHTIQGREADTVILVLGGNPTKFGARRWAAAKPNLLNVAASRARQRLYVIGDHDAWIELPYFRELAGLRRVAPRVPAQR